MTLYFSLVETPVGPMRVLTSDEALCALEFFSKHRTARLDARIRRWFPDGEIRQGPNKVGDQTIKWLSAYFAGTSADAGPLRLEMRGAPFEVKVWQALRDIPVGTTTTYGAIARQVGAPNASRAVGLANGANPVAIVVPCHRVIGANGTLTGYGGGLATKAWLLDHERRWGPSPLPRLDFEPVA